MRALSSFLPPNGAVKNVSQRFGVTCPINQGDLDELPTQICFERFIAVEFVTRSVAFKCSPSAFERSFHQFAIKGIKLS